MDTCRFYNSLVIDIIYNDHKSESIPLYGTFINYFIFLELIREFHSLYETKGESRFKP